MLQEDCPGFWFAGGRRQWIYQPEGNSLICDGAVLTAAGKSNSKREEETVVVMMMMMMMKARNEGPTLMRELITWYGFMAGPG